MILRVLLELVSRVRSGDFFSPALLALIRFLVGSLAVSSFYIWGISLALGLVSGKEPAPGVVEGLSECGAGEEVLAVGFLEGCLMLVVALILVSSYCLPGF